MSYCIATVNIRKIVKVVSSVLCLVEKKTQVLFLLHFVSKICLWFPGNLIADGMVYQNLRHPDDTHWNDVAIALLNGGSIRASLDRGK